MTIYTILLIATLPLVVLLVFLAFSFTSGGVAAALRAINRVLGNPRIYLIYGWFGPWLLTQYVSRKWVENVENAPFIICGIILTGLALIYYKDSTNNNSNSP